jgi:hypothetical protein
MLRKIIHCIWVVAGTNKNEHKIWGNLKLKNLKSGFHYIHISAKNHTK